MGIHATGTFLGMKTVVPVMKENGGGSIINISSIAGLTGGSGASAYTASKGAVRMLTKGAAIEFAKDSIRVNSVHPGVVETPMTEELLKNEQIRGMLEQTTPLPRFGQPEDIAQGVLYLASDESSFVTGIELPIDGGYAAQ
ncbi:short chain dehydrogenase [Melghirimyces thermohalophilus]|uniref:Short chain dehydrogenase n=1 Tax=Melghirimyces thermohalophilus TaxID=1236220 RepID=A0A1G6PK26_9BACL|nr:short chain dehydrogenase [Melghirimyces thermohalophilus]